MSHVFFRLEGLRNINVHCKSARPLVRLARDLEKSFKSQCYSDNKLDLSLCWLRYTTDI